MKRNNSGFSLIELIVVMAIIGIMAVVVGVTVSTSNSAKTEKTAASVNALISKCRAGALGRAVDVHLTISQDGSGNIVCQYFEKGAIVSTETFNGNNVSVSYTTQITDVSPVTVALLGNPLTLSFDRSTGAMKALSGNSYCKSIIFTGGRTYTIKIYPSTGAHELV